ncbi:hypothetical protein GCM10023169_24790 [Georgenia halophila]|uniref:AAA domain-containing protein n=1 Tax=Georgenia halophila TaxID=620889 RepID=A0ABP8LC86_9MICO
MLLLVSGASGVGKTTARLRVRHVLGEDFETAELFTLGPIPAVPTGAWRHEQAEKAVRIAIQLEAEGRHLLFAGDPVPAGEVLAAPSANRVDVAVCLLDADPDAHNARLDARRDPPELRDRHLAFADWMRRHATDPTHMPEVVTTDGWDQMAWERWVGRELGEAWAMTVVDTSGRDPDEVAGMVAEWCRSAVRGEVPVFRRGWHLGHG